jgi:hypothetical protein
MKHNFFLTTTARAKIFMVQQILIHVVVVVVNITHSRVIHPLISQMLRHNDPLDVYICGINSVFIL